ncbi:hypothetical protein ACSS6W_002111 [Trichoderma asperelloides]
MNPDLKEVARDPAVGLNIDFFHKHPKEAGQFEGWPNKRSELLLSHLECPTRLPRAP